MPFDVLHFPGAGPEDRASSRASRRMVATWLLAIGGMLGVMIVLGGTTRLTGSGLSIMEWAPLSGFIPPLDEGEWSRLFAEYKTIPQYHLLHEGFGLAGFKQIFWLEWTHRLWGRLIGLAFAVPLVWLWFTGRIERRLRPRLALLLALGGLQGAVGWFMVASGFFPDSTTVSAYRLVVHLSLALLLYGAILWTAMTLLQPRGTLPAPGRDLPGQAPAGLGDRLLRPLVVVLTASVALTIVAGGFVAGNHAGLDYNTFPLMDGHLVPEGYARLSPWLRNLTENIPAVQFDHRVLATCTAVLALLVLGVGLRRGTLRPRLVALGGAIGLQYALGVATLLWVVPVPLAAAHQAGAVLLLTASLLLLHAARPALNTARIKDMSGSDSLPDGVAQRPRRQTRPF